MIARYPGMCSCGARVAAGQPIHWDGDARRIAGCGASACTGRRPAELRAAGGGSPGLAAVVLTITVGRIRAARESWAAIEAQLADATPQWRERAPTPEESRAMARAAGVHSRRVRLWRSTKWVRCAPCLTNASGEFVRWLSWPDATSSAVASTSAAP